ncbi:MAG TPA: class I SAM-dependent methyltransferase [candidate division Zixibacteria bacterium]|nr:class I SAM-dependent methyltransferase [candidate division Zixibacteria bacterium]
MKHASALAWTLAVLLLPLPAASQDPIPFVPSPMIVVERMLELAEVKKDDVVYDLGSGDGRILITAAKKYGARGVGIDMNPDLVREATRKAKEAGVGHLVEFRAGDALAVDLSEATVVTLYMFKWFNNAIRPKLQKLRPGARVVAHDFDIDDWPPTRVVYVNPGDDPSGELYDSRTLFLWKIGATPPAVP